MQAGKQAMFVMGKTEEGSLEIHIKNLHIYFFL